MSETGQTDQGQARALYGRWPMTNQASFYNRRSPEMGR